MAALQMMTHQEIQRALGIGQSTYYRRIPQFKRLGLVYFPIGPSKKDIRVTEKNFNEVFGGMARAAVEKETNRRAYLKDKESKSKGGTV